MKIASQLVATCSAMPVLDADGGQAGDVPEWVHLLPAGEIRTQDGRGPYRVVSMQAIAAALQPGEKLPIDECHATDRAAPLGQPAPARGWIVELQARQDGLWGKVEWTAHGQQLMADKAYRGLSPVILHSQDNKVLGVLRASLINTPNLKGLVALHNEAGHSEESGMDWKAKLIELLGLDSDADDAAIEAALSAKMEAKVDPAVAEHSALSNPAFVALQSELADVTTQLNTLRDDRAREQAAAFVDGEIARGRAGLKPVRDTYVSLHMANPEQARALIGALPIVNGSTHAAGVPAPADEGGFTAADRQVMALMGLNEEEYAASQKASGVKKEAL